MPTPRAAKHDDLEQRLRDIERQLRSLTGAALSRDKLGVFTGDFVVGDGANVRIEGAGDVVTVDGDGNVTGGLSGAVADAGTALSAANDAHTLATTANSNSITASLTASSAISTANSATGLANAAQSAADAAQGTADSAASTASSAASTASSAASDAATALSTANSAATAASDAQAAADAADAAAASAAGIAGAKADVLIQSTTPASSYQASTTLWIDTTGSANTPKRWNGSAWAAVTDKAATDAASAAAAADSAAAAAQTAADNAASAASAAQGTANTAQSTANTAATNASSALSTANSAASTASAAQTAANGKSKVTYSTSAPGTTANNAGDLWFVRNSGVITGHYEGQGGTSWSQVKLGSAVFDSVDAGKITTGTLSGIDIEGVTFSTTGSGNRVEIVEDVTGGVSTGQVRFHPLVGGGVALIEAQESATDNDGVTLKLGSGSGTNTPYVAEIDLKPGSSSFNPSLVVFGDIDTRSAAHGGDARVRNVLLQAPRIGLTTTSELDLWTQFLPVGVVLPYAGGAAPAGYLACDGSSLLRSDYPELFTAIGTTYGSVDSTHFTLPSLGGKFPMGADGSHARGTTGGAASVTLSKGNIPPHIHDITHSHQLQFSSTTGGSASNLPRGTATNNGQSSLGITGPFPTDSGNGAADGLGTTAVNIQNPYLALNYIIRTGRV